MENVAPERRKWVNLSIQDLISTTDLFSMEKKINKKKKFQSALMTVYIDYTKLI